MISMPSTETPDALADWLELNLLFDKPQKGDISNAAVVRMLEQADVADVDERLGDLRAAVTERSKAMPGSYPVEKRHSGFTARVSWQDALCYSFCLLVSANRHFSALRFIKGTANEPSRLFEAISALAVHSYLGGAAYRISVSRKPPLPKGFRDTVDFISKESQEPVGEPVLIRGGEKDDDLDVISWAPLGDGRPGQVALLVQCGIGYDDFTKKCGEALTSLWHDHLRWHSRPIPAVAVPYHVTDWYRCCRQVKGGLLLDRPRIQCLLCDTALPGELKKKIEAWCRKRQRALPEG